MYKIIYQKRYSCKNNCSGRNSPDTRMSGLFPVDAFPPESRAAMPGLPLWRNPILIFNLNPAEKARPGWSGLPEPAWTGLPEQECCCWNTSPSQ